ncbi:MAG: hypothetical protein BZY88_09845 [SAR202 cluster bacterium Io17-Chloro-G9]|nr:MAG: hypothetical protein BZY88_09845 [SAR202 cluster bacterium Io17-Chloro-G9]
MELVTLERYERGGRLGTGADYEVRTAVDRETGNEVVLKRPVPQMIRLNQHGGAESRTQRLLQAHQEMASSPPGIVPILGYTEPANHDEFFGDSLGHEYRVTVEERAKGIPLLGDQMARITGVPIGVGQNLFALYPLGQTNGQPGFPIQQQILDVEETFLKAGYLLLDLRPQNIFYQPGNGSATVIDCGALVPLDQGQADQQTGSRRNTTPADIHDFFLEILKFYTTPQRPPEEAAGYRDPHGLRPVVRFDDEIAELEAAFDNQDDACRPAALEIINKVRGRSYSGLGDFRQDLTSYFDTVQQRNRSLPDYSQARKAWDEACEWLKADYWRKFLFDPDAELAAFQS